MQTDEDDGLLHIAEANSSLTKLSLCSMKLKQTKQNASALSDINKSLTYDIIIHGITLF